MIGEIVHLRLSDVILDERRGIVIIREGKVTKRHEIPLNAKARKALDGYLHMRPDVESDRHFLG